MDQADTTSHHTCRHKLACAAVLLAGALPCLAPPPLVTGDVPKADKGTFAQEWQIAKNTKLLSEIYGKTSDEPGGEDRLAVQVGFKHKFSQKFQVQGAIGRSVREDQAGGPDLRAYLGARFDFDAPWNRG